jgi:hypothetical protein
MPECHVIEEVSNEEILTFSPMGCYCSHTQGYHACRVSKKEFFIADRVNMFEGKFRMFGKA